MMENYDKISDKYKDKRFTHFGLSNYASNDDYVETLNKNEMPIIDIGEH